MKKRLKQSWIKHTGSLEGFEKTWEIVVAFAKYAFNASHAYCYAYDSVYGAYVKAHYPYVFYSVMLQHFSEKGKKDKVVLYKQEMKEAFGISEGEYKFRKDNRVFSIDEENKCINPSLLSLKGMSRNAAQDLYDMRDMKFSSFIDVLQYLKEHTCISKNKLNTLILIEYFVEFGEINYLLGCVELFNKFYSRKDIKKSELDVYSIPYRIARAFASKETETRVDEIDVISFIETNGISKDDLHDCIKYKKVNGSKIPDGYNSKLVIKKYNIVQEQQFQYSKKTVIGIFSISDMSGFLKCASLEIPNTPTKARERIKYQLEELGYIKIVDKEKYKGFCVVVDLNVEYSPKVDLYPLANGNIFKAKIDKTFFRYNPLKRGDIIKVKSHEERFKVKKVNKKWVNLSEKEWWIEYKIC